MEAMEEGTNQSIAKELADAYNKSGIFKRFVLVLRHIIRSFTAMNTVCVDTVMRCE
jgi:hypothetical protein